MDDKNRLTPPLIVAASMRLPHILLIVLVLLHGVLLLFLTLTGPAGLYNSPDEMANVMFARNVKEEGRLIVPVARVELPSSVVPRSVNRDRNGLIPVGVVTAPLLLGGIGKIAGMNGIPFVLAIVSMLGIAAWYHFLRPLFGASFALLATALLAVHPFVLYWGARPFMSSTLFLALSLISLFFLSRVLWPGRSERALSVSSDRVEFEKPFSATPRLKRRTSSCMLGLCLGLAIAVRPQEAVWLSMIPLTLLLKASFRRQVAWIFFMPALFAPVAGLLFAQSKLYGGPLQTGYHILSPSASPLHVIKSILFPFDFDGARVVQVAYHYLFGIIWWFAVLVIIGIISGMRKKIGLAGVRLRIAAAVSLALAGWLLLYYGSFEFYDRFDHDLISIGTSYTRYFLPFYVVSTVLVASALLYIRKYMGRVGVALIVVAVTVLSLRLVFFGSDESFASIRAVLFENQEIKVRALAVIPPDGIILTDRSDKIFYPEREVVTVFRSAKFSQDRFTELYPYRLYYDTIASPDVVAWEQSTFWSPHGLTATDPVDIGYRHTLYRLPPIVNNIQ